MRRISAACVSIIVAAATAASCVQAFLPRVPLHRTTIGTKLITASFRDLRVDSVVAAEKKKKGALDEGVRTKLMEETIAPWRSLRLFLYGALGSGAFVGGLITLSGVAAALSGARSDLDVNTELLNLGIDFGAVAAFALLGKWDLDKRAELSESVDKKLEKKKELTKVAKAMRQREKELSKLLLEIQVSTDGQTKEAPVGGIQAGARQHMIIVAGPKKACRDALIGANLLKMDFAMSNVLVVPYETDADPTETQTRPSGGFGDRPSFETQPYVARAVGDGWDEYVEEEMQDAVKQNGESAKKEGIAIVIANNGKVIRRGVGKVPWRQMVDQLQEAVDPTAENKALL